MICIDSEMYSLVHAAIKNISAFDIRSWGKFSIQNESRSLYQVVYSVANIFTVFLIDGS